MFDPNRVIRRVFGFSLVLLIAAACSSGGEDANPDSTSQANPTPPNELSADESLAAEEAIERARAYVAAVNEGRVDDLAAIIGQPLSEGERRSFEFHRIMTAGGHPWELAACEVTDVLGTIVKIDCLMENTDPVFVATGAAEVVAPFTLSNGVLVANSWKPLGAGFNAPLGAYVDYLQLFYPDDYAALCDPRTQGGEFQSHLGIARVPECAEKLVMHQDDIVAWVESGRPSE